MHNRPKPYLWALMIVCSVTIGACSTLPKGQADLDVGMKERGIASWYGDDFHGWMTANGEIYDMYALTGAHRTLPLGTVVRVTNVVNGRQVKVRINDRGPYVKGRILDLSYKAAQELNMIKDGVSAVYLEVIGHEGLVPMDSERPFLSAGLDSDPSVPVSKKPIPLASPVDRHARHMPGDVLRERRLRRAEDVSAMDRRVDGTATLLLS